jgi:glutamate--cysteine ligase
LLYDQSALDAAWDLVKDWTLEDHQYLRNEVPKQALHTPFRGGTLNAIARQAVDIADAGLKARKRLAGQGDNESHFLALLHSRVEREKCPAEYLLDDFHGRWKQSIDPIFTECAY